MFPTLRMRKKESNVFSVGYHNPTRIELSLINPIHWKTPFRRTNVVNLNVLNLHRIDLAIKYYTHL